MQIALVIDGKRMQSLSQLTITTRPQLYPYNFHGVEYTSPRPRRNVTIEWIDSDGEHEVEARLVIYRVCPISKMNILIYSTKE